MCHTRPHSVSNTDLELCFTNAEKTASQVNIHLHVSLPHTRSRSDLDRDLELCFTNLHTPQCLWEPLHRHLDMLHGSCLLQVCLSLERQHVIDPPVS